MNSKLYRCGWCGAPTNELGKRLEGESFKKAENILKKYPPGGHVHCLNGECCPNGNEDSEPQMVRITRDMAIDAGDRSLEGQMTKW